MICFEAQVLGGELGVLQLLPQFKLGIIAPRSVNSECSRVLFIIHPVFSDQSEGGWAMDHYGSYPIFIDKRWSLEDLYRFPRAYEQVYFAYEAVLPAPDEQTNERIERAFYAFPWRGGYSAVNFYNQLKFATPSPKRPIIQQMRYASPGYIELFLNLPLALQIAAYVGAVAGSIGTCNKVYNAIYSDIQKRKLLKLDVELKKIELTREQIDLLIYSNEEMAKILGLPSAEPILRRTKNPLVALKILLSIYRRVRTLAEYQNKGKANLSQRIGPDENGEFY